MGEKGRLALRDQPWIPSPAGTSRCARRGRSPETKMVSVLFFKGSWPGPTTPAPSATFTIDVTDSKSGVGAQPVTLPVVPPPGPA